ncbi:MAG: hypothetical protein RIR40_734 [Actinomycetota bacterium]
MAGLEQIDLSISGMTCSSCVGTIERSLNKVPGAKATVNLATESAHVLVPAGTSPKILIAAVKSAGYAAKLRLDGNESFSGSRRMGWRVFLSVLLTIPVILISMFHGLHEEIDKLIIKYLNEFQLPLPLYSPSGWAAIALTAPVVLIIAWPIHRAALRNFFHPTMDNLISLGSITAFGWSIYANSTGAGEIYAEVGASVVTLIIFGRYLESLAKRRAGSALSELLSLNPKEVIILRGTEEVTAPIENLTVGDLCIVKAGERFPTDGLVIEGTSSVDNSLLTGESIAIEVSPGSKVIAGAINLNGRLIVETKRIGADTELARITKMVLAAQSEKAPIQRLADRISNVFVPIVILLSLGTLGGWLYLDNSISKSVSAAVAVLIIACPCALGLATPVALLVATGRGANQGIVLRRASVLEQAPKVDLAVLDKTGTLTSGQMQLIKRVIRIPEKLGLTEEIALSAIYSVVRESNHPVAKSITKDFLGRSSGYQISKLPISDYQEDGGTGIGARVNFAQDSVPVVIGSPKAVRKATLSLPDEFEDAIKSAVENGNSVSLAAIDGIAVALFEVGDTLRTDSAKAISHLQDMGIETWLLSGDNEISAINIAKAAGISSSNVIARATPEIKLAKVEEFRRSSRKVLMIGDGINDAAALASADLSMAMGTGTDTAIATADITLMRPSLLAAVDALRLSKKTLRTIRGNLLWAFIYNLIGIPIAALGALNPMYAGGAMAFSSLFVVLNSLRINRTTTLAP